MKRCSRPTFAPAGGGPQGRSESLKFTGIKNTLSRVEWRDLANDHCYKTPMRIYPAVHYTMGRFWVDYNLMSNIPGLHILGEANFSDHGANRLGASALMQGQKMG